MDLALALVDYCEAIGISVETYVSDACFLRGKLAKHIESYEKSWVGRLKLNCVVYHKNQRTSVKEFGKTLPMKDFREVLGKSYWVCARTLEVNKLGRVRIVVCYDNKDLEGEPVYLATNRLHWDAGRVVLRYSL